eukprot:157329-Hanusia_phi.AAC.1
MTYRHAAGQELTGDGRNLDGLQHFMRDVIVSELMETSLLYQGYEHNSSYGILFGNALIANASLRQVRIKSDACDSVHDNLVKDGILDGTECYPSWSLGTEDTIYSKSKAQKLVETQPFHQYSPPAATGFPSYVGSFGVYEGGGFVASFTAEGAGMLVQEVSDVHWIDAKTRALFFEVFMYSPNDDLFVFSQTCFEFPAGGFVLPSSRAYAYDILRYKTGSAKDNLENLFFLLSLYYIFKEVAAFRRDSYQRYLHFDWPLLELLLALLVVVSAGLKGYYSYMLSQVTSAKSLTALSLQKAVRAAAEASGYLDAAFG